MLNQYYIYSFRRSKHLLILLLVFLCNFGYTQQSYTEYELKAGYIANFHKFVKWPSEYKSFKIGIVGQSPFGSAMDQIAKQAVEKNKKLIIKYYSSYEKIQKCHILFITKSQGDKISEIIDFANGKQILTIGDEIPDFCDKGGMINLTDGKNGRPFEINLQCIRGNCLTLQLEVMHLAIQKKSKIKSPLPCSTN